MPKKAFLIKNSQIRHFWSQIQAFLYFSEILQLDKCEGVDFKYYNVAFKSQPKIPKLHIFGPNLDIFVFSRNFCNQKNSRVLISNMAILFSDFSPKIPKQGIFGPNFGIFIFAQSLVARRIRGR